MSRLLEEAVARARQLPESKQDAIAQIVIAEIEAERPWLDGHSSSVGEQDALVAGSIAAAATSLPAEDFSDWEK